MGAKGIKLLTANLVGEAVMEVLKDEEVHRPVEDHEIESLRIWHGREGRTCYERIVMV